MGTFTADGLTLETAYLFTPGMSKTDREAYFRHAGKELSLTAYVIEKDYYVSLILKIIFECISPLCKEQTDVPFLFKGGTTLSKVYDVINRMSEDIDLSMNMCFLGCPEPETEGRKALKQRLKKLNLAAEKFVSDDLMPVLEKLLLLISEEFTVKLDPDCNQNILIHYPLSLSESDYEENQYILPRVKIETGGRGGFDPHNNYQLQPMSVKAWKQGHDAFNVSVLDISRTFFEKVTLLHELNSMGVAGIRERLSRHLYDIHMIYQYDTHLVDNTDLLEIVRSHKAKYFSRATANWELAKPGTLNLIPVNEVYTKLEEDWNKMNQMFPNQTLPYSFAELIVSITNISKHINKN